MRYKITATTKAKIEILCDMVADTRKLLGAAPPAARVEWDLLRPGFPTAGDVVRGFVSHSENELIQIRFGLQRFRATLGGVRLPLPSNDQLGEEPLAVRAA